MQKGCVQDWEAVGDLWDHAFRDLLKVDPRQQKILVTESPLTSPGHRQRLFEELFERFGFAAATTQIQAALTLYAQGATPALESSRAATILDLDDLGLHKSFLCQMQPRWSGLATDQILSAGLMTGLSVDAGDVTHVVRLLAAVHRHPRAPRIISLPSFQIALLVSEGTASYCA